MAKNKKATWIREGLVARVRHLRGEEKLRHATLQSLDVDKPISDDLNDRHGEGRVTANMSCQQTAVSRRRRERVCPIVHVRAGARLWY